MMKSPFVAFLLLLSMLLSGPAMGQSRRDLLVEDQAALEAKLATLKSLMNRLATRYANATQEEKKHKSQLLRQGLEHLEQSGLDKVLAAARRSLGSEKFNEAQARQQEAGKILDHLETILLEQEGRKNLEERLRQAEANLDSLKGIIAEQDQLKKKTDQVINNSLNKAEKDLLGKLQKLIDRQEDLKTNVGDLAGTQQAADMALALNKLQKVSTRLGKLSDRLHKGKGMAPELAKLNQAIAQLEKGAPEDWKKFAENLARQAGQSDSAFPRAAAEMKQAAKTAAQVPGATDKTAKKQGEFAREKALVQLKQARQQMKKQGADPGHSLRAEKEQINNAAGQLPFQSKTGKEARKQLAKAAAQAEKAAQSMKTSKPAAAAPATEAAKNTVDRVIKDLKQALQAGAKEQNQKLANQQDKLAGDTKKTLQDLQAQSKAGKLNQEQQQSAGQGLAEAGKDMKKAANALKSGQDQQAAKSQRKAADALRRARDLIRQRHRPNTKTKQQLADLAKQQDKVAKRILELAKRLKRRQEREAKKNLEKAEQHAKQASKQLRQSRMDEGRKAEEKTQRELDKAKQKLQQERDRYLNLRQEDLLFKLSKELEELIKKQKDITASTQKYDTQIQQRGRASRIIRRRLRNLAVKEKALAGTIRFLREAIAKENARVYEFILQTAERNLEEVAKLLSGRPPETGFFTQSLQAEITSDLSDLLLALKRNIAKREKDKREKPPTPKKRKATNESPGKNRLVPRVAELKVLKALQEDLMNRTDAIRKQVDSPVPGGVLARIIAHLADRQEAMGNLFRDLFKQAGLLTDEDEKKQGK